MLLTACSLVELDGLSDGVAPRPDAAPETSLASAPDAGPDGSAPDAIADAGDADGAQTGGDECAPIASNLLASQNPGFEDGCALWAAPRASLASTMSARCGKLACRVCPDYDQDPNGYAFRAVFGISPKAGERYVFSAWIRREDGSPNSTGRVAVAGNQASPSYGGQPLMTAWGKSTAIYQVSANDTSTEIVLLLDAVKPSGNECVVFDDASLVRVP